MEKSRVASNEAKTSHILGIDYGAAKIGLALADLETRIAFAYTTLDNNKNLLQKLAEIIKKENVRAIVIGVPAYVNKVEVVYEGEKLGDLMKEIFPDMPIEYQDEMFTTKMAQANLIERGEKGVAARDDEEAARIILQSWIDKSEVRNSKSETNQK